MNKILVANQKGGCGKTSIAVSLACALAHHFINTKITVALADADPQKSSLQWLKSRPNSVPSIIGIDWRDEDDIGEIPKTIKEQLSKDDWLVIDGQGAMSPDKTEQLIAECDMIIVPVLPSFFDINSTKRFLKNLQDIKRVRKGKVEIYLVANRVRSQLMDSERPTKKAVELFDEIGAQPLAWLSDRSIYQLLAEHGLTVFDRQQKPYRDIQAQWSPILNKLLENSNNKTSDKKSDEKNDNKSVAKVSKKVSNWYE